jgi:hypothetical protein
MAGLVVPRVSFGVRRFVLRAPEGALFPAFAGAVLRGAVGRSLRRLVCATHMLECEGCPVRTACVYAAMHDGYTPPDIHSGTGPHAPAPLWLRDLPPGGLLRPGDTLAFSMAAFGAANRSLPFVDESIRGACRDGIGQGRRRMELVSAEDEVRADLADLAASRVAELRGGSGGDVSIRVRLVTPVAIRPKGSRWAEGPAPSWTERLLGGAARRLRALERRWLETPAGDAPRAADAAGAAGGITVIEERIRIERVKRYSAREGRPVEMHGAVGTLRLGGEGLGDALPWLVAGELLGLGSGTTFGLGRIALAAEG